MSLRELFTGQGRYFGLMMLLVLLVATAGCLDGADNGDAEMDENGDELEEADDGEADETESDAPDEEHDDEEQPDTDEVDDSDSTDADDDADSADENGTEDADVEDDAESVDTEDSEEVDSDIESAEADLDDEVGDESISIEEFEAFLIASGIDVQSVDHSGDTVELEYISHETTEAGIAEEIGYVSGAYAAVVDGGDDSTGMDVTIQDATGEDAAYSTVDADRAQQFVNGEITAEEFAEEVLLSLEPAEQ